jgi:hypothetical protein
VAGLSRAHHGGGEDPPEVLEITPESKLKSDCRKIAVEHGCKLYSAAFKGRRGFPDHVLLCPGRAFILIEFKRPGGLLSEHQVSTIIELRMAGQEVWIIYRREEFSERLGDVLERAGRLS